ncbi:hypothetical protein NHX12_025077 [Muraenolepis orangiensis]|uniref:Large ribosomal subunit protein mL62 n=1 Tax=Muraenolepis orangiensis TaxID=630683 RepID=A0A9Q0EP83_9TELE|nr:hypothetical protein NHX12_025077 [Muraenolepis orangiensis]
MATWSSSRWFLYRLVRSRPLSHSSRALTLGHRHHDNQNNDNSQVSYSRSSGAGGQHVNKVNTKAEVRFHLQTADWIPLEARNNISDQSRTRINKAGELLVTSEVSRSQRRNLDDCLQKISSIISRASERPGQTSPENLALWDIRTDKRNKERLKQKKLYSAVKQSRRVDVD